MKRFLSILLTLTMIIGLAASALAAAPYTLTYDANGGNTVAAGTTDGDGKIALGTATHAADADGNAIALIGWTETKDEKIYAADDSIPATYYWAAGKEITLTENKTLYALWGLDTNGNGTADAVEPGTAYTLTYDANNGTGAPEAQKGKGTVKLSTTEPTREGYKFLGWVEGTAPADFAKDATNPVLTNVKTGGTEVSLTADTKYYAQWAVDENKNGTADYAEDRYTVKYDIGNEITKDGVVRTLGTPMTSPEEEKELVSGTTHTLATPSPATNTAKYDVEEETANVAFLGWTTDPAVAFKLYDVGDTVTVVKEIDVGDNTANKAGTAPENEIVYYAVWGYDNNTNGKADIDDAAETAAANEGKDTIKITVKPSESLETQNSEKYTAYKIFDVTKSIDFTTTDANIGDNADKTQQGFSYTIPADSVWLPLFITKGTGDNPDTPNTANVWFDLTKSADGTLYNVALKVGVENNETTAKAIAAYLKENIPAGAVSEELDSGKVTYTNPGYYLITSSVSEILMLATTNIDITSKDEYISDKKIAETASVAVGEKATYYIEVAIPASIDTSKKITVHDKLAAELSFNKADLKAYVTTDVTSGNKNEAFKNQTAAQYKALTYTKPLPAGITLIETPADDDCTFEIEIDPTNYAGEYVVFQYTATLTSDAVKDTGYVNEEYSSYSNYETTPSKPEVKTYDFDILKIDGNNNKLDGAKFELHKVIVGGQVEEPMKFIVVDGVYKVADADDTGTTTTIVVDSKTNGSTKISGVGASETPDGAVYHLVETEAPAGFNKLDKPIVIVVKDNGTITFDGKQNQVTAGSAGEGEAEGDATTDDVAEVVNQSGTVLPSTGGIGTTIFYIVGGLLAVGAGVVLVTKKRMGKEEN